MKPARDISAEEVREFLEYDPASGAFRWLKRRGKSAVRVGGLAGFTKRDGYTYIGFRGRDYMAHRLAWLYVHGRWPAHQIDHRDGSRSNNRLSNLREATGSQNMRNKAARGYYRDRAGKYVAYIYIMRKQLYLGRFVSEEEALAARKAAAITHYGDFIHRDQAA